MTENKGTILPVTWTIQLKEEIQAFHAATGMKHTVIGKQSVDNPRVWERLISGGTITLEVADRLRAWMLSNQPTTGESHG